MKGTVKGTTIAIVLLAIVLLLLSITPTANAARVNLIPNGGFENGTNSWLTSLAGVTVTSPGICDSHLATLNAGFIRNEGYNLIPNKRYKLTFQYRGRIEVMSTWSGVYHESADWTQFKHKFTADATGGHARVWIMGTGQVDCIKLVRLKNAP